MTNTVITSQLHMIKIILIDGFKRKSILQFLFQKLTIPGTVWMFHVGLNHRSYGSIPDIDSSLTRRTYKHPLQFGSALPCRRHIINDARRCISPRILRGAMEIQ